MSRPPPQAGSPRSRTRAARREQHQRRRDRADARRPDDRGDQGDQDVRGHDLQRQAGREPGPADDQPGPAAPRPVLVDAPEAREQRAEHQGVGLEGAAVADRHREDGERRQGQQRDSGPLATTGQAEEPPPPQDHRQRRDQPARPLQRPAGRAAEPHRRRLEERRLDQEQVRQRGRVQLGPEEPRAPFEVARDHRRRDLPPDVVLDDRLIGLDRPHRQDEDQQAGQRDPFARCEQGNPPAPRRDRLGKKIRLYCFEKSSSKVVEKFLCVVGAELSEYFHKALHHFFARHTRGVITGKFCRRGWVGVNRGMRNGIKETQHAAGS